MATGKRWNRDELLIVLNLYNKLLFGQFDQRQPVIIDLAKRIGRTPSSVAMKLSNFASLDPALQIRGIKGLKGASNLDREVWEEFHANPAEMVPLSQQRFDSLFVEADMETTEVVPGKGIQKISRTPTGKTEVEKVTKQRHGQDYFRDVVINNFGGCCGLTGLPIRELLVASHILPWSTHESERLNVSNGICLNRLHDAAFDRHLISFDEELRMILSKRLKSNLSNDYMVSQFDEFEGIALCLPDEAKAPNHEFMKIHRRHMNSV